MTTESRCPSCGSLVRPDAGWCSLCHADLRSEEEKAAALSAPDWVPEAGGPLPDPGAAPDDASGRDATDWAAELAALSVAADTRSRSVPVPGGVATQGPRGRHARPTAPASDPTMTPEAEPPALSLASVASAEADAVLAKAGIDVQAMLAQLAADPDPLAPLTGRLSTRGSQAVAALVATVALIAAGILVMFVLGSFLH